MNKKAAAQDAAIKHRAGPALVIAGPGSGKTYTITKRLENLINNCQVRPSNILTITYTSAAAKEMRSRAFSLLGSAAYETTFGTFHSVFFSILKNSFSLGASNILKADEKFIILCDIARKLQIDTADMACVADELSSVISRRKNGMDTRSSFSPESEEMIVSMYTARLKEERLIDFDDMILKCRSLFEKEPAYLKRWQEKFRYIQIDEVQDIDRGQYETISLIAGKEANLFAVGDDDQSIYGFRGADPGILQSFLKDHPEASLYELSVNYRCSAPIVRAADRVIHENKNRIEKHHSAFDQTGDDVDIRCFADRRAEVSAIKEEILPGHFDDCCVLSRTNDLAWIIADELQKSGVPVVVKGKKKSRYETDIAKDVTAYLKLASGMYKRQDLIRVMNKPMRFISREAFNKENAKPEDALIYYSGRQEIYNNVVRFQEDLHSMGRSRPEAAMRYLMKVVGYERYLKSEGRTTEELYCLYEEASDHTSIQQWLKEIEEEKALPENKAAVEDGSKGVKVMTLHASKGLEFGEVYIVDVNEGIIPYHKAKLIEDIEEERRLFYVGMTRAVKRLHIFYIQESMGKILQPSSFLRSIINHGVSP